MWIFNTLNADANPALLKYSFAPTAEQGFVDGTSFVATETHGPFS